MKRTHDPFNDPDAHAAAIEGTKGAVVGAIRYGVPLALLSVVGYRISPIYRGLTFQFKVFIQMSGMVLGSMIEADRRVREYEVRIRRRDAGEVARKRRMVFESEEDAIRGEIRAKGSEAGRLNRKLARDEAVWQKYEQLYEGEQEAEKD